MAIRRAFLAAALLAFAGVSRAQFIGYVSTQTVAPAQVFTAQAANGSSATLANIGQSAHFLTYCNSGFRGTISLLASPDGTFAAPVTLASASYTAADSSCHILQAGGYFPTIRANVSNFVGGSVNAWYTGTASPIGFAPPAIAGGGPTSPVQCDSTGTQSVTQSTTAVVVPGVAGQKIYVCQINLSFSAATTAGQLSVGLANDGACTGYTTKWATLITSSSPQTLPQTGSSFGAFLQLPVGTYLCVNAGAITANTQLSISWAQF